MVESTKLIGYVPLGRRARWAVGALVAVAVQSTRAAEVGK
jgi:hypothetical protein